MPDKLGAQFQDHPNMVTGRTTARLPDLVQPRVWLERRARDRYRRTLAIVRDRSGRGLARC
jgi:hypothetical protein